MTFTAAGECTVTGPTVHITGPGTCTITASQAGDGVLEAGLGRPDVHDPRRAVRTTPRGRCRGAVQRLAQPDVTVSATDAASKGPALTAPRPGFRPASRSRRHDVGRGTLPGARTWRSSGAVDGRPGDLPRLRHGRNDEGDDRNNRVRHRRPAGGRRRRLQGRHNRFAPAGESTRRCPAGDGPGQRRREPGDIRNATVTFTEGRGPLRPGRGRAPRGRPDQRIAGCTVDLALGSHDVDAAVDGDFTGDDEAAVIVAEAERARPPRPAA